MALTSFDEARPINGGAEGSNSFVPLPPGNSNNPQRSSRNSSERSPSKSGSSAELGKDPASRASRAQELIVKLHREEKIRDAAGAMLADLNYGQGQQHKLHGNMIKQLNNLNSLKSDSQHKKKVKAQFEAAEREVQSIHEQLHDLGIDEDEDISSDDDGPTGMGHSFISPDDHYLHDEDGAKAHPLTGLLSSSAASSAVDLTYLTINPSMGMRDGDHPDSGRSGNGSNTSLAPETAVHHIILILEALDTRSNDTQVAVDKLAELISTVPSVVKELRAKAPWAIAVNSIRPFLLDKDPSILGLGLRLLRLLMVDIHAMKYFKSALLLEVLLAQVLSKDDHDKNHQLRLHATQLVRAIVNIPGGVSELTQGTFRALVAVAEQSDDDIRHICIETLAELMVIDPEKVFEGGGVKVMLNAMIDTEEDNRSVKEESSAFSLAVTMAFSDAADCPRLRQKYLRDGRDLSALLTYFTDAPLYGFTKLQKAQLQASAVVMQSLLRSWVGLSCFDLRLFVQCMIVPISDIQETLLNVLDNILWLPQTPENISSSTTSARNACKLSHQFTAVLLSKLQWFGLQEKIVLLQTEGETEHVRKRAQYIGSKIFLLSSQLIPRHAVICRSMAIPQKLSNELAKSSPYSLPTASIALFGSEAELQKTVEWESKPNLQTFIRFGLTMDDASFKRLVNMTHVLDTKMFRQWNWDALMELAQGPLRSQKRFEELSRNSRFLKRVMSFYRPFKFRFSFLTITRDHLRYVEVGKELMLSLLETDGGISYLKQNKLFRQIAECLAQLDPLSGIMSSDPLFSVKNFKSTLSGAYSELIGVLSYSPVGQEILAQNRIFNMFYRVCEINREDVMRSVICTLDYRMEGHPRLILAKALTSASKSMRLYATEFVGTQLATKDPHLWAIDLMVEQLYDSEISVANAAVHGLHVMCATSGQALDYLISMKPLLGHLAEAAEPLKMLFMSRPRGFELLLSEMESRDVRQWAPEFNAAYVEKIESYLEAVNSSRMAQTTANAGGESNSGRFGPEPFKFPSYSRPPKKHYQGAKLSPPAHFYGELALTDQGCRFLKSNGAISELNSTIEDAVGRCTKRWPTEAMLKLKGALWAVGHVASRPKGALLLDLNIAKNICLLCENTEVYSLRGTAFYCLGLFALSPAGAELLHQCGWDVVYDSYSQPLGVTLPPDTFFTETDDAMERRRDRMSKMVFPPRVSDVTSPLEPEETKQELSPRAKTRNNSKVSVALPISPVTYVGKPGDTVTKSNVTVRSGQVLPQLNTSFRLRTPSVHEVDPQAPPLRAPSISSSSMLSPTSALSNHHFDFGMDPELSSRRSSCFDLIEAKKDNSIDLILKSISQLGSYVLAQTASRTLVAMRASHPDIFGNGEVLKEVAQILASGHYKQVTRRFVFELFDIQQCLEKLYKRVPAST